jgi:hypothetical protein
MSDNRVLAIESKIDQEKTALIKIDDKVGGISFKNVAEMMDFSRLMAVSDKAVPLYLRGNIGSCLAICVQADEWGFSPFALARMSYVVNDQIGYFAQLLHAVIERRAPLKQRLRFTYEGEGPERVCICTGHMKGEVDALEYRTPKFKDINPKNSPLWKNDPDQQQAYMAARAWCRRYCPDILLGAYGKDELEDSAIGADNAKDVTPKTNVLGRLSPAAAARAGFNADHVHQTLEQSAPATEASAPSTIDKGASPAPAEAQGPTPALEPSAGVTGAADADPAVPAGPLADVIEARTGQDYPNYVFLTIGRITDRGELDRWWKQPAQRKLRNSLPNMTSDVEHEALAIIEARKKELEGHA